MSVFLWIKNKYYLFNSISDYLDLYFEKYIEFFRTKSSNRFFSLYIYILIFCLLSVIAGFRHPGVDRDSFNYIEMIKTLLGSGDFWLRSNEISFSIIVHFADKILQSPVTGTFLIYAILGIGIKLFVIRKESKMPIFSIFVYMCIFYILLDMTQIRVSVASAIFLFAVSDIVERRPANYFLKAAVAFFFHYSALVMIPFYFISNKRPDKYFYLIMPVIAVIFGYFNLGTVILKHLPPLFPSTIEDKLYGYINIIPGSIRAFAPYFLSKVVILYYCLILLNKFTEAEDYILIKIYAWAIVIFYMFFPLAVIAVRTYEFFLIVQILLFPSIIMASGRKTIMAFLFTCYLLMTLINQLFIKSLLDLSILFGS